MAALTDARKAVNLKRAQSGARRAADTTGKNSPGTTTQQAQSTGVGSGAREGFASGGPVGAMGGGALSALQKARQESLTEQTRHDKLKQLQNITRRQKEEEKTLGDKVRGQVAKYGTEAAVTYLTGGVGRPVAKIAGKAAQKIGESKVGWMTFYGLLAFMFIQTAMFISLLVMPVIAACTAEVPAWARVAGGLGAASLPGPLGVAVSAAQSAAEIGRTLGCR